MKHHQITASMAKDIAFKLGAVLDDEEAGIFADGYNVALLQSKYRDLSQPVDPQISEYEKIVLRAGWVMVPVEPTDEMIAAPVTPDGWISCSERMPEMGGRQCYVLAADFKNNYPPNIPNTQVGVYGDWFNDGNPTWDDGDGEDLYLKEVTHWMPLPAPPQQEVK